MDIRDAGTRFVISGQTGVGKTHVAERISAYVSTNQITAWARGWWMGTHIPSPCFLRWPDAVRMSDQRFEEAISEAAKARLTVLDDLGAETDRFKNDDASARLLSVFEAMRPSWKWVLIATNVPVAAWKQRWDQRIADRLMQFARIDLSAVPSYRISHAK